MKKLTSKMGMIWVSLMMVIITGATGLTAYGQDRPAVRLLVWSEGTAPKEVYPNDINGAIAEHLTKEKGLVVKTVNFSDLEHGLTQAVLDQTDVLFWWGHRHHGKVSQEVVDRVVRRVKEGGMGFVAIHSAHYSKPFKALAGPGDLGGVRNDGAPEHIHVVNPTHPIAKGIKDFTLPQTEMYNEPFKVAPPDVVVFHSKWDKGEEFRSGCVWTIGKGKVFYFRPGHETYPIMHNPIVVKILTNAAFWAGSKDGKDARP